MINLTLIGFKRMTIGIHDSDGTIAEGKTFVVEGKQNEGATVSAEISGLSSDPVKVYGSNVAYYVLQKGTGDVSVDFGVLDMLETVNDEILGYKKSTEGFSFIGDDTEPPYCSVILESENLKGETALLGFFRGKFAKESITMNTKEGENQEPEADEYTFSVVSNDRSGETSGQSVAKYVGIENVAAFKALILNASVIPVG